MRPRTKISTPFPTTEETAAELGVDKERVTRLARLLGSIEASASAGRSGVLPRRGAARKRKKK
jgi:hypothetical protein